MSIFSPCSAFCFSAQKNLRTRSVSESVDFSLLTLGRELLFQYTSAQCSRSRKRTVFHAKDMHFLPCNIRLPCWFLPLVRRAVQEICVLWDPSPALLNSLIHVWIQHKKIAVNKLEIIWGTIKDCLAGVRFTPLPFGKFIFFCFKVQFCKKESFDRLLWTQNTKDVNQWKKYLERS